jgi:tetratricopeptide (TPR) repeat protein
MPDLEYECEKGTLQSAIHGVTSARVINLWATWCQPCLAELTEWAKHAGQYADVGLEVVAVNVDETDPNDPRGAIENVCQIAERLRLPFTMRFASPGLPEKLDAIQRSLLSRQRPLPLPTSFLVDRHGQLRAVYKGPVDAETLLEDAKLVDADSARILDAALPFSGRWLKRPSGSHPLQIALKLIEGDYQDDALIYIKTLTSDQELNKRFASASLLNLLGALSVDKKQFPQAAEAFARALELDPTNRTAHIELGTLLLGVNRGRAAEMHFRHVLEATPDDPEQHYKLGLALLQQNRLAEAREQMQTVLKLRDDALAHWQMGEIFLRLRDAGQAIASYERAIELKPALATTANNLAWLLATIDDPNLQDPPEAVRLAKKICQSTDSPGANELDTLAAAYAAAEDYRSAVEAAEQAIEIATEQQNKGLAEKIRARNELYKQRKPVREKL